MSIKPEFSQQILDKFSIKYH